MRAKLAALAAGQHGAFTSEQALTEYTPREVRTRIERGDWCRVFRGVFRRADTEPTPELRVTAAALRLGCEVAACRDTAAELHGIGILNDPVTHVLSARTFGTRVKGLAVHREATGGTCVRRSGLWTTNAPRTVIDLARHYERMDALALLDVALRRGISREALADEVTRHSGKRGFRQATELLEYASPKAESPMESRTRMRIIDAGLPAPDLQIGVPIPFQTDRWVDLGWRRWKIGVEYDSIEWHSGQEASNRDTPRHNWLTREGWTMFYVTPHMVYRAPNDFLDPIADRITELGSRETSSALNMPPTRR